MGKGRPLQPLAQAAGVALAAFGQRQVGEASVLAGDGPWCLAMAGQVNSRQRFAHDASLGEWQVIHSTRKCRPGGGGGRSIASSTRREADAGFTRLPATKAGAPR